MNELPEINCDVTGEEASIGDILRYLPVESPLQWRGHQQAVWQPFVGWWQPFSANEIIISMDRKRERKKNQTERNKWCGYYGKSAVDIRTQIGSRPIDLLALLVRLICPIIGQPNTRTHKKPWQEKHQKPSQHSSNVNFSNWRAEIPHGKYHVSGSWLDDHSKLTWIGSRLAILKTSTAVIALIITRLRLISASTWISWNYTLRRSLLATWLDQT